MAIAKKPNRSTANTQPADPEKAAEAFIAGAGGAPEQADARKLPVMIRFDRDLLARVDAAAKRRGISRSAWVQYTLSRALDTGEG
jgi:predicted HicB family RNase H-like nuclease